MTGRDIPARKGPLLGQDVKGQPGGCDRLAGRYGVTGAGAIDDRL